MADRIFPSENDVHDVSGSGRKPTEENLTLLRNTAAAQISHFRDSLGPESVGPGGVLTGYDFSSGTATSIILTAGTATIEGFAIETTTPISAVLTASSFNYVFLTLDDSGGLVTGISLTVRPVVSFFSALTIPARSILLWCFETNGVDIITQFDFRTVGTNVVTGSYTGSGAATKTFDLGFRPKMVHVYRSEDPMMVARSPLAVPRGSGIQFGLWTGELKSGQPAYSHMTNDPELVPIIVKNGFTVEDGPGTVPGPHYIESKVIFDPPSISAGLTATTAVTVVGAKVLDLSHAQHEQTKFVDILIDSHVTAADTVTVRFHNVGISAVNIVSGTLTVGVWATDVVLPSLNELNKFYFFIAWY